MDSKFLIRNRPVLYIGQQICPTFSEFSFVYVLQFVPQFLTDNDAMSEFLPAAGCLARSRPLKISGGKFKPPFTVRPQRLIEEPISGPVAASERPGFARLLGHMENGDVLIISKLDHLDRDARVLRNSV